MRSIPIPEFYRIWHGRLLQEVPDECDNRLANLIWLMMGHLTPHRQWCQGFSALQVLGNDAHERRLGLRPLVFLPGAQCSQRIAEPSSGT
jgi:hypothetical protein